MLRFAEEIILLLLDDDGRELVRVPFRSRRKVLAAAVLMDLALENRIDTDPQRLFPVNAQPLGDDLLDLTLARITAAPIHDTGYWLERIAEEGDALHERVVARLVERGILRHRGNRSPWSFRSPRYPIVDSAAHREVRTRVTQVLAATDIPAPRDIALICLADACGLLDRSLFGRDAAAAAARIAQIRRMDLIGRTLSRAIWDIRAALLANALRRPLIGLALGAGALRGWSHIGVIQCLESAGIAADVVCGTSSGALVGGFYASGMLDSLETWARRLTIGQMMRYLNLPLGAELFGRRNLVRELAQQWRGVAIEKLAVRFAAVTTELETGRETLVRSGSLARAVLASSAYPGLLPPVKVHDRWMIDGVMVNPVPVSACRALGAEVVIAVNLNRNASNPGGGRMQMASRVPLARGAAPAHDGGRRGSRADVIPAPPDILIEPRLGAGSGLFGASQADSIIAAGRLAAERSLSVVAEGHLRPA